MEIALCMAVKDEADQIADCLDPVHDLFSEIVIVDTGSTDGTPELLARRYGIEALRRPLDAARCHCLCDARAAALDRISAPWAMLLDADERLDRRTLESLRVAPDDPNNAGFFGPWANHVAEEPVFDDYKLFLFRADLRTIGLVHDVAQLDIRARGLSAAWLDSLKVEHFPDPERGDAKAVRYRQRLLCAIRHDPGFYRYHWFLGYTEFRAGRWSDAERLLGIAAAACSKRFPVETLNSATVLAELQARRGDTAAAEDTLTRALAFHAEVADDFEVVINARLRPWLQSALRDCRDGRLDAVRAYRFAC